METISKKINNLFSKDKKISLKRGGPYYFIRQIPTTVEGEKIDAFEYQISQKNKKRVTLELINSMNNFYIQNGRVQDRFEIKEIFNVELRSRPCNYSVAKYIVEKLNSRS